MHKKLGSACSAASVQAAELTVESLSSSISRRPALPVYPWAGFLRCQTVCTQFGLAPDLGSAGYVLVLLQICDEQATELRRAEEQLAAVEAALQQRTSQAQQQQSRISELEAELGSSKHEQRTFGSAYAAKDRDNIRRIETLQDEVEHQQEQVTALEKLLRERTAQTNEQKEKVCAQSSGSGTQPGDSAAAPHCCTMYRLTT